eukprot:4453104-Prymnesium_polylepis.1
MIVSTNHHSAAVGSLVHTAMEAATPVCIAAIKACQTVAASCTPPGLEPRLSGDSHPLNPMSGDPIRLVAIEACNAGLLIPYTLTGMNPYDMRIKCAKPPLCCKLRPRDSPPRLAPAQLSHSQQRGRASLPPVGSLG